MPNMRVAMYYRNDDIRIESLPMPKIADDEILVKIIASGICGSDVMEWYRIDKAPLVLGHEVAGIIEQIGSQIKGFTVGERIVVAHHVPCNTCRYCLSGHETVCDTLRSTNFEPGGFAEYIRVPAINIDRGVFSLPGSVSFEAGTFVEPLACVVRGQRLARLAIGNTVVVVGSGIAGMLHIALARASGAHKIIATDLSEYRRRLAASFGADLALRPEDDLAAALREINYGRLADLIVLCTGAQSAIENALSCVERGGTILFFAPTADGVKIPLSINETFWRTEITLTSSYAGNQTDHETALRLIDAKRIPVEDMITHRLSLEETMTGFKLVADGNESLKVIIEPQR